MEDDGFELIVRQAAREFMGLAQRRQPESTFFHYAPERGLVGILETATIWATDYRYLNDQDELLRGEQAVQAELEAIIAAYPEDTSRGFLARQVEKCLQGNRITDNWPVYVASFSSARNHLGQFRLYADDAQGYALGFNSVPLPLGEQVAKKLDVGLGVDFRPCIYNVDEFRALAQTTLFYIADAHEKYTLTYCRNDEQEQKIRKHALGAALSNLGASVPFLKDPGFADEMEWRLMFIGKAPEVLTRDTQRYGVAPYIKVDLKKGPRMDLHEVIAGPRASLDFLKSTAERFGYGAITLTKSRIPYR